MNRVRELIACEMAEFRIATGKDPVFCLECDNHSPTSPVICNYVIEVEITPTEIRDICATPDNENKDNNCEYYVSKREKYEVGAGVEG